MLRVPMFAAAVDGRHVFRLGHLRNDLLGTLQRALHGDGSFWAMFAAVMAAFMPTQLPLGIAEGFVTAIAYRFVLDRRPELLGAYPSLQWIGGTDA